jgi:hypothetical protein
MISTLALGPYLAGMLVLAVTPQQEAGKKLLNEVLAAVGGKSYLAMADRVESGRAYSFYRERLSGLTVARMYTRYVGVDTGGLKVRERQAFGKDEDSAVLFAAGEGYEITFRGARPMPPETLARYKDSTLHNIFYILRARLDEPGLIVESRGRDIIDNQPAEILEITDAENRVVTVYLNQGTKLPIRQIFFRRNPATKERDEEMTLFSKYRDVGGGVMWPFSIQRERNGEKVFQIYSESVAVNQGLRDDLFTLPADIKILGKKK